MTWPHILPMASIYLNTCERLLPTVSPTMTVFIFISLVVFLCEKEICDIAACCLPWDQHGTEQLSINSAVYFPIYGQLYFPIYWQLYFPIYGSCIYQKLNSLHCAEQLSWHSPKFVLRCQIKSAPAQPLLAHVCACVAYNGNTLFKFSLNGHANVLYWEQKNKNGKTCPPTYLVILIRSPVCHTRLGRGSQNSKPKVKFTSLTSSPMRCHSPNC